MNPCYIKLQHIHSCNMFSLEQSSGCSQYWFFLAVLIILCILVQICYVLLLKHNASLPIKKLTNIYTLRMALAIPCFSLLSVCLYVFSSFDLTLAVIEALIEGTALWSFYKLCLSKVSEKYQVIEKFKSYDSWDSFPCSYCYHKTPVCCWNVIEMNMLAVLFIRPVLFGISSYGVYTGKYDLSVVCNILAIIILVVAMISLLRLYNAMGDLIKGLFIERKIISLKLMILVILVQNQYFNGVNYHFYDSRDIKTRNMRIYTLIVSMECFVFAMFFQYFFSSFDVNNSIRLSSSHTSPHTSELLANLLHEAKSTSSFSPTADSMEIRPIDAGNFNWMCI